MTTPPLHGPRSSADAVRGRCETHPWCSAGRASPQRGDLQVTSAPVAVGGPALRLEIAETVR